MSLDSGYTCPMIDVSIESIMDKMKDYLSDKVYFFDKLTDQAKDKIIAEIYDYAIDEHMENVRDTNAELRDNADRQIDYLDSVMLDLKREIDDLEEEIEKLKKM